jgi:hypothetical protein
VTPFVVWRHLRGRRSWRPSLADVLVGTAAAAVVAVLVLAAGANTGLGRRSDASAWRVPVAARGEPTARLGLGVEFVAGHRVVEVAYASLVADAPVPPGLSDAPQPGDVFVSPALARLVASDPVVAARFGSSAGILGDDALEHPGELVAVEGHAPDDAAVVDPVVVPVGRTAFVADPVAIDGFNTHRPDRNLLAGYRLLLAIATVLVVVPALTVAGGAARLLARRRAERLSILRLLGARPSQVAVIAAMETALVACAGAVVGIALGVGLLPLLARVPVAGGRSFAGSLVPPASWCVAMAVAVPLVVVASTLTALRPVIRDPLATVRRSQPGRARAVRFVLLAVAVVVFPWTLQGFGSDVLTAILAWGSLLVGLSVLGPFVVRVLGWVMLRSGRGARSMLAARRLLDDPRGAFRLLSPLVLPAFVAGVLAVASGAIALLGNTDDDVLEVARPTDTAPRASTELAAALTDAGIEARVDVSSPTMVPRDDGSEVEQRLIIVRPVDPAALEDARAVVTSILPRSFPATPAEDDFEPAVISADFPRGASTMLIGVGALAATATGLALASTALDERSTLAALRALGVPIGVVADSRRRSVVAPFLVCGVGAAGLGALCATWMIASIGRYAVDWTWMFGLVAALGVCLVMLVAAESATRPLLRAVSTSPDRFADR